MDMWGSTPADQCTGNAYYGCERSSSGMSIINPIQSARIRSTNAFNIKYGRIEVSARLPKGDWLWPAIWMLPRYNSYGMWPSSGEVDIVEGKGNREGRHTISSSLHFGPTWSTDPWRLTHKNHTLSAHKGKTFHDDFHVFGLYWDRQQIYTYIIDSEEHTERVMELDFTEKSFWERGEWDSSNYSNPWLGRSNAAPFDQHFYLIMNVAVGGVSEYFPDNSDKPWVNSARDAAAQFYSAIDQWLPSWQIDVNNGENAALQIDWVKVYQ